MKVLSFVRIFQAVVFFSFLRLPKGDNLRATTTVGKYGLYFYQFQTTGIRTQAVNACSQQGTTLVRIKTAAIQNAIGSVLRATLAATEADAAPGYGQYKSNYWCDGDNPKGNDLTWKDSTQATYSNWISPEPNRNSEKCVGVAGLDSYYPNPSKKNYLGKWFDIYCTTQLKHYICQRELVMINSTHLVAHANKVEVSGTTWFSEIINATIVQNGTNHKHTNTSPKSTTVLPQPFNYVLDILSVANAGNYMFNLIGKINSTANVISQSTPFVVYVPANISLSLFNLTVGTDRAKAYIDCISFGYNVPSVTWHRGSTLIPTGASSSVYQTHQTSREYSMTSRLELKNANKSDESLYVCKVSNTVGLPPVTKNIQLSAQVYVESTPQFVSSVPSSRNAVPFSTQLNLSCTYLSLPLPTIYWSVNDIRITSENTNAPVYTYMQELNYETVQSTLVIYNPLILGPKANFSCHAENSHGRQNKYFSLDLDFFDGNYYLFSSTRATYQNAKNHCLQYGLNGDLAVIASQQVHQFVQHTGKSYANAGHWMTEQPSAYIGATRKNNFFVWHNGSRLDSTFTAWYSGEPKSSDCVVYSNQLTDSPKFLWKTGSCFWHRHFICQFPAMPVHFLPPGPVTCAANQIAVRWADLTGFNGDITFKLIVTANTSSGNQIVYDKTKTVKSSINHEYETLLTNLNRLQQYTVQVEIFPKIWSFPVVETVLTTTSVVPDKALNPVLSMNLTACHLTWMWPTNIHPFEITGFTLHKSSTLYEFASDSTQLASWKETKVDKVTLNNVTNPTHLYNFVELPNRKVSVSLQVLTCSESGLPAVAQGHCVTIPKEPDSISKPVVPPNTKSLTISPAAELNGPISCYFAVAEINKNNSSFKAITSWDQLQAVLINNASGWHCVSAISRFTGNSITKTIGSGETTSCNVKMNYSSPIFETYSCTNKPLMDSQPYNVFVVSTTATGNSIAVKSSPSAMVVLKVQPPQSLTGIIIGVVMAILLVALIVIGVLIYRKRNAKKTPEASAAAIVYNHRSDVEPFPEEDAVAYASVQEETAYVNAVTVFSIPLDKLLVAYNDCSRDPAKLKTQYEELKVQSERLGLDQSTAQQQRNKDRNRYKNIVPFDFNRVKLKEGGFHNNDYVNASYITGYDGNVKFIAAQAPRAATLVHFWQMIWENNCKVVVMLTNLWEGGKNKCEKYWPEPNDSVEFGNFSVKTTQEESHGSFVVRTFSLVRSEKSQRRFVTQCHYSTWPDHGVPVCTTGLIRMHRLVKEIQGEDASPVLVHCSAGVGRTGTYIALDVLQRQMAAERRVDVFTAVLDMRKQRTDMVQNLKQYILVHKLLVEMHVMGDTDMLCDDFAQNNPSSRGLQAEFKLLDLVPPMDGAQSISLKPENIRMCRDRTVLPYDRSLTKLSGNSYINASFVQAYDGSQSMIVTQGPTSENGEQFWQMVSSYNASGIVMLTSVDEDSSAQYWKDVVNSKHQFGSVTVAMTANTGPTPNITRRDFVVTKPDKSTNVTHLQCDVAHLGDESAMADGLLQLVSQAHSIRHDNRPIVVHCRDGAGLSGVFCALSNILDRCRIENRVDVFRTVKDLRDMRPHMVRTQEDYLLLYEIVRSHLSSRSIYANLR